MSLSPERLRDVVAELASRPQHEKVRSLVYELLVNGLGANSTEVSFETRIPEVHGRIDALLGRTIFEFKTDLRRETASAEEELARYLAQREAETRERFVGIATDGAHFVPYELRSGVLRRLSPFSAPVEKPRDILAWLSSVVAVSADLDPTPETVNRELGRASLAWQVASSELKSLWDEVKERPDVRLKRDLWAKLMERVYGSSADDDLLFFQHTYLSIIAKTLATHVLGIDVPDPSDLLSGRRFGEVGIGGAVESDFFDWLLAAERGQSLVGRIALQAGRFRLRDIQTDVLKGLYESLVDPETRHFLGEYYTPDWLAHRVVAEAVGRPLEQRVLDPACGSGTFVFHAVRRLLEAADGAGIPARDSVDLACRKVFGMDIHPVAVQIARVTFLLALGQDRLRSRPPRLTVPVYMGDSLQWNTRGFLAEREVLIEVPGDGQLLEFPFDVARDPSVFDQVIDRMLELSHRDASPDGLTAWLQRSFRLAAGTVAGVTRTYDVLRELQRSGRNHIWGFVARNLVRPVWLSQEDQRADVIIGNPPWLSYRYMDTTSQKLFKAESERRGLWAGGKVATQQDLSAYFFVRSIELYLNPQGTIAFVMPYAAMTRKQFEGFRTGLYGSRKGKSRGQLLATAQFTMAWTFTDEVQPLFPVPSCVLFACVGDGQGKVLPVSVAVASGTLPRRDSSPAEAGRSLVWRDKPWPSASGESAASPYADDFLNGATIFPRVLAVVEAQSRGQLGENFEAPVVQSRRTSQEKQPWKALPSLRGNVEREFLRPLYFGESIAPYRLLGPILAVIPVEANTNRLLDATSAERTGYFHLSQWMGTAESLWSQHAKADTPFVSQLDYYGKLTAQFPVAPVRVIYSKSGTVPAAAILRDVTAITDHTLYWARVEAEAEALYLLAILNSETARSMAEGRQARGQWGARHFDKVILSLPIPRFDPSVTLHQDLAAFATHAMDVAAAIPLPEDIHFVKARQLVRAALREDGVGDRIDQFVSQLLR